MMIENIEVTMYLYDIYYQDMNTLVLFMVLKDVNIHNSIFNKSNINSVFKIVTHIVKL